MDQERQAEAGDGAQVGSDTETKCLSRLEPGVPIHLHCPDPPHLTVVKSGHMESPPLSQTTLSNHSHLLPDVANSDAEGKSVVKKVEPGLSSLAEGKARRSKTSAIDYIKPLLQFAADHIPK